MAPRMGAVWIAHTTVFWGFTEQRQSFTYALTTTWKMPVETGTPAARPAPVAGGGPRWRTTCNA
jgi:hypothetical protein